MLSSEGPLRVHSPYLSQHHISPTISSAMCDQPTRPDHVEHIWIIAGPAGSGKSTVGLHLAKELSIPYIEGDEWHSEANRKKMGEGHPLDDADRWDWLVTLREQALRQLQNANSVIVTCSSLKRKYRDVIRIAHYEHPSVQIHFIFLRVDESNLQQRVAARKGHYMKADMVKSQINALEDPDDEWDVLPVDVRADREEVLKNALDIVKRKLAEYPTAEQAN